MNQFAATQTDLHLQGPDPVIQRKPFQQVDIARLLDPDSEGLRDERWFETEETALQYNRRVLEGAFDTFAKTFGDKSRRNRVQDRLMAASEQRCGEYKRFLNQFDSGANFTLGSLATAAAGLGSVFTAASTVRALSGAAAILSGVRGEMNADYFYAKTMQTITAGINAKRAELATEIRAKQRLGIADYSVEAATWDSVRYDEACGLITGLEMAAASAERSQDPGMRTAIIAAARARQLDYVLDADPEELFKLGPLGPLNLPNDLVGLTGTQTYGGVGPDDRTSHAYGEARIQVAVVDQRLGKLVDKLKADTAFAAVKDDLDKLRGAGSLGRAQNLGLLDEKVRVRAVEQDKKVDEKRIAVIGEIDATKRHAKGIELQKQLLDNHFVLADVRKLLDEMRSAYTATHEQLESTSESDPKKRITAAAAKLTGAITGPATERAGILKKKVTDLDDKDPKIAKVATSIKVGTKTKNGITAEIDNKLKAVTAAKSDLTKLETAAKALDALLLAATKEL